MYYIPLRARHVAEFWGHRNKHSLGIPESCVVVGDVSYGHSGVDESRAQSTKGKGGGHSVGRLEC